MKTKTSLDRPSSRTRLLIHGMGSTVLSALLASFIFAVLCLIWPLSTFAEVWYPLSDAFHSGNYLSLAYQVFILVGFTYLTTTICAVVPALIGGFWLSDLIHDRVQRNRMTERNALREGTLIGGFAGFSFSIVTLVLSTPLYQLNAREFFTLVAYILITATLLAAFSGRHAGKMIFNNMTKNITAR